VWRGFDPTVVGGSGSRSSQAIDIDHKHKMPSAFKDERNHHASTLDGPGQMLRVVCHTAM